MSQSQPQQNQRQLRLDIPANLNAIYSNAVVIAQTASEIIFDFVQIIPTDQRAKVQSRIVMTPANAKLFLRALEQNLSKYEEKYGEIAVPPTPPTLADQLFGTIRPDDDKNE
jgi:hypothetical protein